MSIYDEIEARGAGDEERRRKLILAGSLAAVVLVAVGIRMWIHRVPAPPSLDTYEELDGVVAAQFEGGTLALTVGTEVAARSAGGRTEMALWLLERTGTLEYRVMELRDTAGTLVARAYPDGRVDVPR